MDAARWQRLSPLLDVLLELGAQARAAQLEILRAQDPELADDLEKLLALEDDSDDFMAQPLLDKPGQPQTGMMVGPYRMESVLGEGGMGMVWLASRADGLYERKVALKLLRPGLADPNLRLRFSREREILARLAHPNIARLLDAGIGSEGQPYLALEYVQGIPITDYCQTHGLSVDTRLKLFLQVCEAVSHAHANLIVHRDLKPSNILVTPTGEVRLLDFGIAKLLDDNEPVPVHPRTEVRSFTLHYAAPEQVRGELVTTMTDVYSLGVVLYELLAGTKPYRLRRQTDAEWEQAILAVEPLKPSLASQRSTEDGLPLNAGSRRQARRLKGDLDNIALKALAKLPEHRYASVEALSQDLQRHLQGRPVLARPQSLSYRVNKYVSRHRLGLAVGAVIASVLLLALAASVWQGRQAMRETARAQAMQDFVIGLFDNAGVAQQGNIFDARKLLVAGERRGERELADQPLARAELLGVIARLRIGLGDYQEALALLERQEALLAQTDSASAGLRLEAVTQHGRTLRLLDRTKECLQVMAPFESQVPGMRAQPAQQADFLSQYGRCRRLMGERQTAEHLYERSLALRRELKDETGVAENLYDLALIDNDLGRTDDALAGYDAALKHLRKHVGQRNALAVEIEVSRGRLFRARGDTDRARATFRQALAIAEEVHGPQHPVTLTIRRLLVAIQVDQERYAESERQIEPLYRMTLSALGPNHRETGLALNTRGVIAFERGRMKEAIADVAEAVRIWRGAAGSQNLHAGLFNYGMVLHGARREDEALKALLESRQLRAAQYGASDSSVGEVDRMIGEVLASQGKLEQATAYFDRAVKLTRVGLGPDHPRTLGARLSMARQQARLGQGAAALSELQVLQAHPGTDSETSKLHWSARAYAAEIQCRDGQRERGKRELDALIGELRIARPDGGAITREALA
ncbi:MAG: protein kinase domain-containing protein, partial [Pseudoxanthomonas sp.]